MTGDPEITVELGVTAYGKRGIRLLCVSAGPAGEEVTEVSVLVLACGGAAESYLDGDNRRVVTTDAQRAVVIATLGSHGIRVVEDAAIAVAGTLRRHYPFLPEVQVELVATRWWPIPAAADGHGADAQQHGAQQHGSQRHGSQRHGFQRHGFHHCGGQRDRATAIATDAGTTLASGWAGPPLLLTRGSRFVGFVADERTPNSPAEDRAIAGDLDVEWEVEAATTDHVAVRSAVRVAALDAFQAGRSESVQHLLTTVGRRVLAAVPLVRTVTIRMDSTPLTGLPSAEPVIDGPVTRAYVIGELPRAQTRVTLHRPGRTISITTSTTTSAAHPAAPARAEGNRA